MKIDLITLLGLKVGQSILASDAMCTLISFQNPQDPYRREKAAGSLGGATRSGFLKRNGNIFTRMR